MEYVEQDVRRYVHPQQTDRLTDSLHACRDLVSLSLVTTQRPAGLSAKTPWTPARDYRRDILATAVVV